MSGRSSSQGARTIFQIKRRGGIWHVTRDARFYGDYAAKRWAIDGVNHKAGELRAAGQAVQIVLLSAEGAVESDQVLAPSDRAAL